MVVAGLVPDEGEFDPVELQGYGSVADCLEEWAEDHSSGNLQPDLGDLGLVDAAGQTLPTGLAEPAEKGWLVGLAAAREPGAEVLRLGPAVLKKTEGLGIFVAAAVPHSVLVAVAADSIGGEQEPAVAAVERRDVEESGL